MMNADHIQWTYVSEELQQFLISLRLAWWNDDDGVDVVFTRREGCYVGAGTWDRECVQNYSVIEDEC